MIHENLKRIRAHFGATQQQLADYLNVSPQSISKWEKGEVYELQKNLHFSSATTHAWLNDIRIPSIEHLDQLADYMEVSVDYLLGRIN
jgi:transcriptional regulator with XRE-family HTH domain